ncbi:MAG TPA: Lpg1974 family pore-forming outer membrane protein [Rhabdochlamydiaceae bacterium]|jgi:hypothetical protein|nr:Lpg1974 family pore-forming outer membrane protein [Rhabdochlamydiaceae bacterium]
MNKNLLFSMLALTACAFADGDSTSSSTLLADDNLVAGRMDSDCKPKPVECKPKPKPCEPCVRQGMAPNVLTSSRPCTDVGVYFFADALYWHADVTNSEWAFVNSTGATSPVSGANQELAFKWNWGFRVGLGYSMDHDQWDTDLYYTWFVNNPASGSTSQTAFTNPAGGSASSLNSALRATPSTVRSGTATTKLNFQVLDWELGRSFYVSNSISLRPHVGLKGAWIKLTEGQTYTATAVPTSYSVSNSTKSWEVGPSAGINSNWFFGCGNTMPSGRGEVKDRPMWSIFGDVSGALMYGHFSNSHSETGTDAAGAAFAGFNASGLNRNLMVPVLSGILGLAWDYCFDCDKMHFGIRAGYELQYWFRQNQRFSNFNDAGTGESVASPRYTRTTGDLALQGLTIDVRFDF